MTLAVEGDIKPPTLTLHGEQGGESLHREFNKLGRVMQGVQNETEKLFCTMKEHHTSTSPIVQSNIIHPNEMTLSSCSLQTCFSIAADRRVREIFYYIFYRVVEGLILLHFMCRSF